MSGVPKMRRRDTEDDEQAALHVLRLAEPGEWTPAAHVAARLGVARTTVSNIVARLVARGVQIERNRSSDGGYRLVRDG
jgi:biotin operon repressor